MTSKNMYTINFKNVQQGSPEEVLLSFKNKKGTYARIFETLCGWVEHVGKGYPIFNKTHRDDCVSGDTCIKIDV